MISKKHLIGGLNTDDSEVLIDKSEYLGAFNVRFIGNDSKDGRIASMIGNNKIDRTIDQSGNYATISISNNTTIGAVEDAQHRRIIFFNFDSTGEHTIYCYYVDHGVLYTVLKSSQVTGGLNFNKNNYIHSASVVENLLYWTDNINEPRRINIDSGIKMNHPTFQTSEVSYVSPLMYNMIGIVRPQPAYPIKAEYIYDATILTNYVSCQAAYRFVYKDNEESTFSVLSTLAPEDSLPGYLRFTIPFNQKIQNDIKRVELAIKYLDGSKYLIQKTWDIEQDAALISSHNSGTIALVYNFKNESVGISVDDLTATQPFHNVPLLAGTLEIARDRLFMGNTLSGYQSPSSISMTATKSTSVNSDKLVAFKTGVHYTLGIVYYDEAGRYCPVVEGASVTTENRVKVQNNWATSINWAIDTIPSQIPLWAKTYSIVSTKSSRTSFFIQTRISDFKVVYKDASNVFQFVDTTSALPSTAKQYGVGFKISELSQFGLGYSFQDGDLCNIYTPSTTYKVRVLAQYSDYLITESFSSVNTDVYIGEIYTPSPTEANEFFYEQGNKYEILNAGTVYRSHSVINGSLSGDVRIKQRVISGESYYVESMNFNDNKWINWYTNAGRVVIKNNSKVNRIKTNLCYSNTFSYSYNGLSDFTSLNFTILPLEMSSIQKIILSSKVQAEGTVMIAIGDGQTAAVYLGESQVFDNSGSSFIAKSNGVIGNINILKGSFGTLHPESVSKWEGNVYFFDSNRGKVIRYDVNGLFPISDIKMSKYFRKLGSGILNSRANSYDYTNANPNTSLKINSITDPYTGEFLICIPRMNANVQNRLLEDMKVSETIYNFTVSQATTPIVTPPQTVSSATVIINETGATFTAGCTAGGEWLLDHIVKITFTDINGVVINDTYTSGGTKTYVVKAGTQVTVISTLKDISQTFYCGMIDQAYISEGGVDKATANITQSTTSGAAVQADATYSFTPSTNSTTVLTCFGRMISQADPSTITPPVQTPIILTVSYIKAAKKFTATLNRAISSDIFFNSVYADGYDTLTCGSPAISSVADIRNTLIIPAGSTGYSWSPQTMCGSLYNSGSTPPTCWDTAVAYTVYNVKINNQMVSNGGTVTIGTDTVTLSFDSCRPLY